ncbi:MAG: MoaA/NifB/PqqE/SkfB family radical SAM enzyme, partial [Paraglaciecola sp.]
MFVNWNDVLELASKLTVKRIINALRITISYIYARYTKKAIVLGLPISISVEPTTACNLKCPECPSGLRSFSRPTGKITLALFEKIVRDVSDYTSYLTFYFQGEPYL